MLIRVRHTTEYRFDGPVAYGLQRLRLTPVTCAHQIVRAWRMDADGGRVVAEYDDHFDNRVALVELDRGARGITLLCEGRVATQHETAGVVGVHRGSMPLWIYERSTPQTQVGAAVRMLDDVPDEGDGDLARLHRVSQIVREAVTYTPGVTTATTTADQAAAQGAGVCQDHAHIFIGLARRLGYPARYVSGYLLVDDRVEHEAGHAWAEAHVPGLGWVGFDVSNGISPDERYVRVAVGRDYADAAPLSAITVGARDTALEVSVEVHSRATTRSRGSGRSGARS